MKHHIFTAPDGESSGHRYHSFVEVFLRSFFQQSRSILEAQTIASILLIVATLTALVWASIPSISHYYQQLLSLDVGVHVAHFGIDKTIKGWVNDFLLTLFFFYLGLEVKRELLVGELADYSCFMLVVCAAIGGMLVPGLLFWLSNLHSVYQHAWGIPLSTDTAFVLGILACFRRKLPAGAFTFMAGLAIIDDIIALLIIALFYSHSLHLSMFGIVLGIVSFSLLLNYCGVRQPLIYLFLGLIAWYFVELSGVHGAIAGVLIALTVPARPERGPLYAVSHLQRLLIDFKLRKINAPYVFSDQQQHIILENMRYTASCATTPLQHWRTVLEAPVAYIVLPLFAFCNAGLQINFHLIFDVFCHWMSLSIIISLIVGKVVGVTLFSKLSLWLNLGRLPKQTSFKHIACLSVMSGIGFTMSLFTTMLSFHEGSYDLLLAKASVIVASMIAALMGIFMLFCLNSSRRVLS